MPDETAPARAGDTATDRAGDTLLAPAALPPVAWRPLASAMVTLAVVLSALSDRHGFHRDELYFRMLRPAWGYVDQPPLTPLLARLGAHLSDGPWAMRIPATLAATVSVLVVVLITRELGGGRAAQTLCAWAYAFAATPLLMGHVLLTASLDLVLWPLVCLFLIRALLREQQAWWLAVGVSVGLSTYNKLLIALLVVALAAGIVISGPRRPLWSKWVLLAVLIAAVLALPNLLYQLSHSWPQLTMGRALSKHNAGDVRIVMWPYLPLLLGPPLVPIWVAGLVSLARRPAWRPVRFLAPAFGVLLIETFVGGGQLYYPIGLLSVIFAAGCVPAAEFLATSRPWRVATAIAVTVNAAVSAVIALPLLPLSALADSPVPAINQTARDQIGWPEYVGQVAAAYRMIPSAEQASTVILASNYGEAGAITRYGPALGLPRPYSGQNELYFDARPPDGTTTAVVVGGQLDTARAHFGSCDVVGHLHNRPDIDNEEQGEPIAICRGPRQNWPALWHAFLHYD